LVEYNKGLQKLNIFKNMAEICKCGMPLDKEEDKCKCDGTLCYHCCACSEDCECGCKSKKEE
jgi:hypothetical protein